MEDFLRATNDWDLEAIIRGWGGGGGEAMQLPPPPTPVLGFDVFEFDESKVITRGVVNELEEMYKPFVAKTESPRSSQTETTSPSSSSFAVFDHQDNVEKTKEMDHMDDHVQPKSSCKRRKNKQKIVRVVHRGVGEDGIIMDKWNWRKYGQKAIKGSPYPRSYYRCSSSGGCHARKHVEQSKDDCHTFIVTYIADHSHAPPTRRHAQAGRKITKFASSKVTPPPESGMTWTISDPSIVDEADQTAVMSSSDKELFTSAPSFDYDFSVWEFDPFFT